MGDNAPADADVECGWEIMLQQTQVWSEDVSPIPVGAWPLLYIPLVDRLLP